ncbi:hypothetical protein [Cellulomonas soli]|uniref:Uncharacterized protein n=1 Tax=Cellulomonas soli TaxID=931535 RepID=A0A512PCB8_9CELL|nr:hypothetical protein [Cellulomonas soli]NYI58432.1 hypothetical protein [Cellulomonas soli]GEP68853.1 hypothetical protein CSO01_15680 [Cellulomonas soli]
MLIYGGPEQGPWAFVVASSPFVAAAIVTTWLLVRDWTRPVHRGQAGARAARHARLTSLAVGTLLAAGLSGVVGAVFVADVLFGRGRVLVVLPSLCVAVALAAQAAGELTWPRPAESCREADVSRRTVADLEVDGLRVATWWWSGLTLVTLLLCVGVQHGPRTIARDLPGGLQDYAQPFPGSYYAVPLTLGVLGVAAAGELVLRLIVWRPAVSGVTREWDLSLRRRSARTVAGGVMLTSGLVLAATCLIAGLSVRVLGQGLTDPYTVVGIGLIVMAATVLVTSVVLLVRSRIARPAVAAVAVGSVLRTAGR